MLIWWYFENVTGNLQTVSHFETIRSLKLAAKGQYDHGAIYPFWIGLKRETSPWSQNKNGTKNVHRGQYCTRSYLRRRPAHLASPVAQTPNHTIAISDTGSVNCQVRLGMVNHCLPRRPEISQHLQHPASVERAHFIAKITSKPHNTNI